MLGDGNTLLVTYRDEGRQCIECKKCVRVCHMGIDIRTSPLQIECVHCGECIDACADVLGRLGKQGLIHYTWGESGSVVETETAWYRKLGIRDAKRVVVLLVSLFYLAGLSTALSMRRTVLVQIQPVRASLYRVDDAGLIYNKFRLKLANRGGAESSVRVTAEGLPGAALVLPENPMKLPAGAMLEREFEVTARSFAGSQDVNRFRIVVAASGEKQPDSFEETFLMPSEEKRP
jgi:polyferredoxin